MDAFNIIFFQNGLGQKRTGIEKTVYKLYLRYKSILIDNKYPNNKKVFFIKDKKDLIKNLNNLNKANEYFLNKNICPIINVGGDHSMAIGTLSASLNKYKNKLKVIWIDAHADINTRASSPSGNYHGMPLGFLTGLDKLDDFTYIKNYLPMENLCYIGIRDLDSEEINVIKTNNIKTINSEHFNSNISNVLNDIDNWIGNDYVHLSIDVDGLDPKYIRYTGTICSNGLELNQLLRFLGDVCKKKNIVNVDLTELNLYNPDLNQINNFENKLIKKTSKKNFDLIMKTLIESLKKK
jgi:arginase